MKISKSFLVTIGVLISPIAVLGSCPHDSLTEQYLKKVRKAQDLFFDHQYRKAAKWYMKAFDMKEEGVNNNRRFRAACAWAGAGKSDSAFRQLFTLVKAKNYKDINQLVINPHMRSLKGDPRYPRIKQMVRKNRRQHLGNHDTALLAKLDTIYRQDQRIRGLTDPVKLNYGRNSDTLNALWDKQKRLDSLNQIKVEKILEERGWPFRKQVGEEGSETIFLVLQHADHNPEWQEEHLPEVRKAAKTGKIDSSDMAMFVDRVAVNTGQKQVYGTQIGYHEESEQNYVKPLRNPMTLKKRRKKVGLPPMDLYLTNWDIEWDAKTYKKNLPKYMKWHREE